MCQLEHAAKLERMSTADPTEVVVVAIDRVLRSVVGITSPSPVPIAKSQVHQVLIAIGHVRQAELVLPVADILLWRVVILPPVIAACIEMVELSWTEDMVPAKPQDVSILMQIVIVRIQTGQRCRSIRAGDNRFAIVAVVAGNAVLLRKAVIALDAPLVDRADVRTLGDHIVVGYVTDCPRSGAGVRR